MDAVAAADRDSIRYPWADAPSGAEAVEVADGILWLRLPLPMALDHVNVYALDDDDGWTVIDTGFDSSRTRAAWEAIMAGPLGGRPVRRIVVTHYHPDHVGLAGWFQNRGAELVTTRTSWILARMLVLDKQDLPVPETVAFWRDAGMAPDLLARRSAERPFNFADVVSPLPLGYSRIKEGDTIRMGGRDWLIRTGDGHAPEHATFWEQGGDLVIGGDQLLPSISANLGVYASEPEADPIAEWIASCRRLAIHATPEQLVLPGHKLPFTGLPLRLEQMIDNHVGALARLTGLLAEPKVATQCFDTLFKRPVGEAEYGFALVEAVAHLNHLWKTGTVARERREDGAWLWQRKTPTT